LRYRQDVQGLQPVVILDGTYTNTIQQGASGIAVHNQGENMLLSEESYYAWLRRMRRWPLIDRIMKMITNPDMTWKDIEALHEMSELDLLEIIEVLTGDNAAV